MLDRSLRMLIDGRFVSAVSGDTLESFDPAEERVNAVLPAGAETDVELAVAAARRAFDDGRWSTLAPGRRAQMLWRLAEAIDANAEELAELETLDNGKPLSASRAADVPGAAAILRYWAGWCGKISGETASADLPGDYAAMTLREPIGVVGLITPWNYPLLSAASKLGPALAAGCTCVFKPAEQTSITALRLGELVMEAGLPASVVNIVVGLGASAGAALARHPGIDKISFTGSTATGKSLLTAAQSNLKRLTLELGGKSPNIIFADADLERAIPGAAQGIFRNAGQVCAAGSRLFVQRAIYDQVVEGVLALAAAYRLGPGLDPQTTMGPLVSDRQRQRVLEYVDGARRDGASVQVGGQSRGERDVVVAPTLVLEPALRSPVAKEEVFGPVLTLNRFDTVDEVAAAANDTPYGLQANVWTRDVSTAHRLAKRIRAGTVHVNCVSAAGPNLPMGGYKQSGWGREGGLEGLKAYTQLKTVVTAI